MFDIGRTTRIRLAFIALAIFFLGTTFVWLRLDHSPPAWDDSYYLSNSLVLYDSLADRGVAGYAREFLTVMRNKPPLIAALPTPVYLLLGRKPRAAYLVNLVFLFVTLSAVYWLGKRYASPRAGLLAAFVAGTMPMIYGLARWFLVECGLTAIVCVAICLLAEWTKSDGALKGALLGAACGLGLLMKSSLPVFLAIPFLFVLLKMRPRPLLATAATAAVIAGPWYLVNWRAALQVAVNAGSATTAKVYGTGDSLSPADIWRYCVNLANTGPALYFLALPILAALFFRALRPGGRRGLLVCALWASPVLLLIFWHYRDLRYAAPLAPALAVAIGILLDAALRQRLLLGGAIAAVLLGLPAVSMLQTSFGILGDRPFELGGLVFVAPRFSYAHRFRPEEWPHREILADLYRTMKFAGGERKPLLVGTNNPVLNADNFRLAALRDKLPFNVGTTAYESDAGKLIDSAAFFLYEEGGAARAEPFNEQGAAARDLVRAGGRFIELPIARTLPDGGRVHVFASRFPDRFRRAGAFLDAGLESIPSCSVIFAGRLELTGLSLARTPEGLEVKYRWSCLKPVDRDYWCFTHIVDSRGNVAGYLDHQILGGDPATSKWKPGDTAMERLLFPLPSSDRETYHLRLGIFDRATGDRMPINASGLPLTDNSTAALFNKP